MDFSVKQGQIIDDVDGHIYLRNLNEDGDILFYVNDGGTDSVALTIDGATKVCTFAAGISFSDSINILDTKKLELGTGKDGEIYSSSDDLYIRNVTEDKDIIISGNDGSVQTTMMTFDSSVPSIVIPDAVSLNIGTGLDADLSVSSDDFLITNNTSDKDIIFNCNDNGTPTVMMTLDGSVPSIVIPDAVSLNIGTGLDADLSVSSDDFLITNNTSDKDIIFNVNDGGSPTVVMTLNGDVPAVDIPDSVAFRIGTGADLQFSISSDDAVIQQATSDKDIIFQVNDGGAAGTEVCRVDGSESQLAFPDGKKAVFGAGFDGEIYSSSDDLYIRNVTADKDIIFSVLDGAAQTTVLTLDADVPQVVVPDAAKLVLGDGFDGEIYSSSDDLYIRNVTQDKDIIFSLNYGSVQTTMLTIDGSTEEIRFDDAIKLKIGTGKDGEIYSSSDDLYIRNVTQDKDIIFSGNDGGAQTTMLVLDSSVPVIDAQAYVKITATAANALDMSGATSTNGDDIKMGTGAVLSSGSGVPSHTAVQGSLYLRTGQSVNATIYLNTDGATTWTLLNAVQA